MGSKIECEFSEGDKIIKTISKDSNSTSFTEFLNSLEVFRREVNEYLSDRIEAIGVTVSEGTDDDDASASEEEVNQPISPKKRRR